MNTYECRYYTGETRYSRSFYTGKLKAASFAEAVSKAEGIAERQKMSLLSVTVELA